jgi:hypothetical protein
MLLHAIYQEEPYGRRGRLTTWTGSVPAALSVFQPTQNHFSILLEFKNQDTHAPSKFKFMKMWIAHHDCINVIKQSWNANISGCPMFVLT